MVISHPNRRCASSNWVRLPRQARSMMERLQVVQDPAHLAIGIVNVAQDVFDLLHGVFHQFDGLRCVPLFDESAQAVDDRAETAGKGADRGVVHVVPGIGGLLNRMAESSPIHSCCALPRDQQAEPAHQVVVIHRLPHEHLSKRRHVLTHQVLAHVVQVHHVRVGICFLRLDVPLCTTFQPVDAVCRCTQGRRRRSAWQNTPASPMGQLHSARKPVAVPESVTR